MYIMDIERWIYIDRGKFVVNLGQFINNIGQFAFPEGVEGME